MTFIVIMTFYYESILIVWQYFTNRINYISKANAGWFEKSNFHLVSKVVICQIFGQCRAVFYFHVVCPLPQGGLDCGCITWSLQEVV